jgi:hypothetical protein
MDQPAGEPPKRGPKCAPRISPVPPGTRIVESVEKVLFSTNGPRKLLDFATFCAAIGVFLQNR